MYFDHIHLHHLLHSPSPLPLVSKLLTRPISISQSISHCTFKFKRNYYKVEGIDILPIAEPKSSLMRYIWFVHKRAQNKKETKKLSIIEWYIYSSDIFQ
jgi:hypothetical protein